MNEMDPVDVASACESIGRNCEFGYYQRELGLEPTSLLRWTGVDMGDLIRGLDADFDGLLETATGLAVPPEKPPEEQGWWLICNRYQITFHSGLWLREATAAEATERLRERTRWLARKLMDDIRSCEKILVYSSAELHSAEDTQPLIDAVRRLSLCPMLIAIEVGGSDGSVRDFCPGVWIAEMPHLTGLYTAAALDVPKWGRVMENLARRFVVA
jgi:hypothetical protein